MSLLSGRAIDWAAAVWESDARIRGSSEHFLQQLREVFEYPAGGKDISTQLLQLSQGTRTAADYAIEFRTIAAQSGWNDISLKAVFQKSLNADLQTELACRALVDSGAALNLIHQDLIEKHHIKTIPCIPAIGISTVDNKLVDGADGDNVFKDKSVVDRHVVP
ncbi:Pol poly [Labeo rohita]|uniref:Pol poly n=1 Tax=Labeo rohita TaxID=84645 RepID=A0A498M2M9_LABRO|nr:Pol poly [Labeo rohita]